MVASDTRVAFERISPVFVHFHDAPHDFIGAQRGRHRGLLCDSRNADSQQSQHGQKPARLTLQFLGKPNHHLFL
jgi:hypothetical protein